MNLHLVVPKRHLIQPFVLAVVVFCLMLLRSPSVHAAGPVCTVGSSGATYTTIQAAVDDSGCATINVATGTYKEMVKISRNVTINGATTGSTIVDGNNNGVVFQIDGWTTITLNNLTIQRGASNYGGGISNNGTLTINNSTISGNSAPYYGGGIYNAGALTINNSTISDNSSPTKNIGSSGGGIYSVGKLTVNNSTLNSNIAHYGGAIYQEGGTLTLNNNIIANSILGYNCRGSVTPDSRNNLLNDASYTCGLTNGSNGNIVAQDLKLGPLQVNAPGTTATHALLTGSPAIDQGNKTVCDSPAVNAKDQRGVKRPSSYCDIGAYEAIPMPPTVTISVPSANGQNNWFTTTPVEVKMNAQALDRIISIRCLRAPTNTPVSVVSTVGLHTASVSATVLVAQNGTHQITCDVGTHANQWSKQTFTVQIDSVAPETTITGRTFANTAASFTFTDNDSTSRIASYQCSLDNALFTACTSPQSYQNLSDKSHSFQVRAVDKAGNVDSSPASYTWRASYLTTCHQIRSVVDNRLLTVPTNNVGTRLQVAPAQPSNAALQLWHRRLDGAIVNLQTGYLLDVASMAAIVYPENVPATLNQRWTLVPRENGQVAIAANLNGYVLDVNAQDNVSVILYPEKTTDFANQRWVLVPQSSNVCAASVGAAFTGVVSASLAETPTETVPATMLGEKADIELLTAPSDDAAAQPLAVTSQIFLPLVSRTEAVHTGALADATATMDTTVVTDTAPPVAPTAVVTTPAIITTTLPVTEPATLTLTQLLSLPAVALPVTLSVPATGESASVITATLTVSVPVATVITATPPVSIPVAGVVTATQAVTTTQLRTAAEASEQNNTLFLPVINTADLAGTALGSPSAIGRLGLVILVLVGGGGVWLHQRRTRR